MQRLPNMAEMEQASLERDTSYDGVFFVGVRTTGIFCRPSCPARKPLRQNVEYFSAARDAVFAGYRPCKRCRPLEIDGTPPDWVRDLLVEIEANPGLRIRDSGLRERGIDPARARRFFLKRYGMTFQAYCRGRRLGTALEQIREGRVLDDVALGNGYDSHSGFREAFGKAFGLPPGRAQASDCIRVTLFETVMGPMILAATSQGLCLAEFSSRRMLEAQFRTLRRHFRCAIVPGNNLHLDQAREELGRYFSGELKTFSTPLLYPGTDFQHTVWDLLLTIPYGETRSYEDLARSLGKPAASRAVGTANGLNRLAIFLPCHRVITKDGLLGGYGGGLWRKQALLDLERRA